MTEIRDTPYAATSEERAEVANYLKATGGTYFTEPDFLGFSRADLHKKHELVREALEMITDVPHDVLEATFQHGEGFIDSTMDFREGKKDLGRKLGRAFLVPMRSSIFDYDDPEIGSGYASESTPFYPMLDPR